MHGALAAQLLLVGQAADGVTHQATGHRVRQPVFPALDAAQGREASQPVEPGIVVMV